MTQLELPRTSLTASLATFFAERPGVWIDGRLLATIAGQYAWRSRCSDLRKPPYSMTIQNRVRPVRKGSRVKVSEYRYDPESQSRGKISGARECD